MRKIVYTETEARTPVSVRLIPKEFLPEIFFYWVPLNIVTVPVFCVKLEAWDFQQG
jgi:hypothetical protein